MALIGAITAALVINMIFLICFLLLVDAQHKRAVIWAPQSSAAATRRLIAQCRAIGYRCGAIIVIIDLAAGDRPFARTILKCAIITFGTSC